MQQAQQIQKGDLVELKRFALMMSWAFPLFFSLLLPWLFGYAWQLWPLALSAAFLGLWCFAPGWIYYPYRAWMALAAVIGWVNTHVILGLTFYLLIWPIGSVLRLFGKLQYRDGFDAGVDSYYVERREAPERKRLEHPF